MRTAPTRIAVLAIAALGIPGAAALVATPALAGDGPGRPVQEIVVGPGLTGGGDPDKTTGRLEIGVDTAILQTRVAGTCPSGQALVAVNVDGSVVCGVPGSGDWIVNGTAPQSASFNVAGSGAIGSGLPPGANKLAIAGGSWNPDDSDGDVLIGDSLYRLKIGVATSGGGAGDVRIRAQGGSNRLILGGGASDTLIVGENGIAAAGSTSLDNLRVAGGNWNPNDSDGDVLIGDSLYRLKIGVATEGGGAGDVRIRAQGGSNRMFLGGGASDTLVVGENGVEVTGGSSAAKLRVAGGNWNVTGSDGDVVIGDSLYRLKIGVATSGGGAGDVRIRAQGGSNRLILGGGSDDTLVVTATGAHVDGTLTKTYGTAAAANAAPVAYGTVNLSGGRLAGTANWSSTYDASLDAYRITITGHPVSFADASTVTPMGSTPAVATTGNGGGDLIVHLFDLSGAHVQRAFSFVVHRT